MWEDIHSAALKIAEAEGLTATTIDRITHDANISRRTFFNYFPTKEAAILGVRTATVSESVLEQFNASKADKFTRVVILLAEVYRSTRAEPTAIKRRKDIFSKYPQLIVAFLQMNKDVVALVEPFIQQLFATKTESGADEARILVATANAILVSEYTKNPTNSSASTDEFITSAITTFRKAMKASL